ncbi:DEAD/DEAH box helicase [Bartonella sp. B17]
MILADEEGLGKGISAGLVLLQAHLEGQKNLLVLCDKEHVNYWQRELKEKFFLKSKDLNHADGHNSFIILVSYQQAYKDVEQLAKISWDLCVLDEAHELISSQCSEQSKANLIQQALKGRRKLLLTSTPIKKSPLDLYYLLRFVDEDAFGGSEEFFKQKYVQNKGLKAELIARAQMFCQRTLKSQALTMQLPRRLVRTLIVPPTKAEDALSKRMSLYFHREPLLAFPKIERAYIRLTFWKLLASSIPALVAGFGKAISRLSKLPEAEDELADLHEVLSLAQQIKMPARLEALLTILARVLKDLKQVGAAEKIVIFSENKTTLSFLQSELKKAGYKTAFAGVGKEEKALKEFKAKKQILLATDRLAKIYRASFCSCVINYDVPWSVTHLEKRISCCHSYGQKHDVLVLNFLDPNNRADRRLYYSLNHKLRQFDEIFGVSETLLGELVAPEMNAHSSMRLESELMEDQTAFMQENQQMITEKKLQAENDLLAHFDEEVTKKFKFYGEQLQQDMQKAEDDLWEISKYVLAGKATMKEEEREILLFPQDRFFKKLSLSRFDFKMGRDVPRGQHYSFSSPLAKVVLDYCLEENLERGHIRIPAGNNFKSGERGMVALWRATCFSHRGVSHKLILGGYSRERVLSDEECDWILNQEVLESTGHFFYQENFTPQEVQNYYKNERLEAIGARALAHWQEQLSETDDKLLHDALLKINKWYEEEYEALKSSTRMDDTMVQSLKLSREQVSNFAQRFKLNKQISDVKKAIQQKEQEERAAKQSLQQRKQAKIDELMRKKYLQVTRSLLFQLNFSVR